MNNINDKLFEIEYEGTDLKVLCDVLFDQWPYDMVIEIAEINGISFNFIKGSYISGVAKKVHEAMADELAEKAKNREEAYDEGDR